MEEKVKELYSDSKYEKPSVTIDMALLRMSSKATQNYRKLDEKVLQIFLIKRGWAPFKDVYAMPGNFIDLSLELSQSVNKCVQLKVGEFDFYSEQLFTFGDINRDPRTRVISVAYLLLTNTKQEFNGEWFDIDYNLSQVEKSVLKDGYVLNQDIEINLINDKTTLKNTLHVVLEKTGLKLNKKITIKKTDLAFDHAKILFYALERLKNKIEYTDIIFNLLPNKFTLTELKLAYEIILGEKLLDANFRRKISKLVEPTNEHVTGKGHRKSLYYCFNPNWNQYTLD